VTAPPAACTLDPSCPASPSSGMCTTKGGWCIYGDGTACLCDVCCNAIGCQVLCGSEPQGSQVWGCQGPPVLPAGCPTVVPNEGAPCTLPSGTACLSTSCGLNVTCESGVWRWTQKSQCPGQGV
jgi:hypothetical protein